MYLRESKQRRADGSVVTYTLVYPPRLATALLAYQAAPPAAPGRRTARAGAACDGIAGGCRAGLGHQLAGLVVRSGAAALAKR